MLNLYIISKLLRTSGHAGFKTPRAGSPHERNHHRDQDPTRPAEPHGHGSRTGEPTPRKPALKGLVTKAKARTGGKPTRHKKTSVAPLSQESHKGIMRSRDVGNAGRSGRQSAPLLRKKGSFREANKGRKERSRERWLSLPFTRPETGSRKEGLSARITCAPQRALKSRARNMSPSELGSEGHLRL